MNTTYKNGQYMQPYDKQNNGNGEHQLNKYTLRSHCSHKTVNPLVSRFQNVFKLRTGHAFFLRVALFFFMMDILKAAG